MPTVLRVLKVTAAAPAIKNQHPRVENIFANAGRRAEIFIRTICPAFCRLSSGKVCQIHPLPRFEERTMELSMPKMSVAQITRPNGLFDNGWKAER